MISVRTQFSGLLLIAVVSAQTGIPALADASVRVGGVPVITVAAPSGGLTPDQRAKTMQKNVDNALVASTNKTPSSVSVTYVNSQPIVTLGGFYVCTVDAGSAKKAGLTTTALANKWAGGLKNALRNQQAVNDYIARLTGSASHAAPQTGTTTTANGSYPYYKQGHVIYIPSGMTMAVQLTGSLSSETARPGDPIEARLAEDINLGDSTIPANSVLIGKITEASPSARMAHAGMLGLKFTTLRTPDGGSTPITAHIVGGLEKYSEEGTQSDLFKGQTTSSRVKDAALRGAIGAGAGALLGTTIGAIASRGYGTGRGAVAGTVIGGAVGVADSLLIRKGKDVNVGSGQPLKLQLDAPASVAFNGAY